MQLLITYLFRMDTTEAKQAEVKRFLSEETGEEFFAVDPIKDCPHTTDVQISSLTSFLHSSLKYFNTENLENLFKIFGCYICDSTNENWVCLDCQTVGCSRFVQEHMSIHCVTESHNIAFSFSDGSYWCYACDSYVTSAKLDRLRKVFGHLKFKLAIEFGEIHDDQALNQLLNDYKKIAVKEKSCGFSFEELSDGLANKTFNQICFVTGAGISVASGIPDFRSPGGLYHTLAEKYNKETPEELMRLDFFMKEPQVLYQIMKEFLTNDVSNYI